LELPSFDLVVADATTSVQVETKAIRAIIYISTALMMLLLLERLHARGGPYFEIPRTVFDHAVPGPMPLSRQAIVVSEQAAPLLPRGATVTVIAPELAPNYDVTHYLTASGFLPRQHVVHPTLAEGERWPDFVIALGKPLDHSGYRLVRAFPEGSLYQRRE
jgi:hypothetical protein